MHPATDGTIRSCTSSSVVSKSSLKAPLAAKPLMVTPAVGSVAVMQMAIHIYPEEKKNTNFDTLINVHVEMLDRSSGLAMYQKLKSERQPNEVS